MKRTNRVSEIWIAAGAVCLVVLLMWGCPKYKVYRARKNGEAALAQAEYERQTAVVEANAKKESAKALAEADTLRAVGIARSNQIIGQSLKDNPSYLQWLWIDQIKESGDKQIIYVPSGTMGMPILEAQRLTPQPVKPSE